MKILILLLVTVSTTSFAKSQPWAASQPLEALTGLQMPADWASRAPWEKSTVSAAELPSSFDWRVIANGLTPVKRQRAGDCWAQGTVGVLESLVKIELGREEDLSVQEVISCSGSGTARRGGYFAHEYHVKKGSVFENEFPYVAKDVACKSGLNQTYRLKKWGYVGAKGRKPSVTEMKQAIMEHGPIGVTIAANNALKRFRGNGVFQGCAWLMPTNHIEVIVGWDDNEEKGVWFVRNSWGADHGENGYAKIPYGCSRVGEVATWADLEI